MGVQHDRRSSTDGRHKARGLVLLLQHSRDGGVFLNVCCPRHSSGDVDKIELLVSDLRCEYIRHDLRTSSTSHLETIPDSCHSHIYVCSAQSVYHDDRLDLLRSRCNWDESTHTCHCSKTFFSLPM